MRPIYPRNATLALEASNGICDSVPQVNPPKKNCDRSLIINKTIKANSTWHIQLLMLEHLINRGRFREKRRFRGSDAWYGDNDTPSVTIITSHAPVPINHNYMAIPKAIIPATQGCVKIAGSKRARPISAINPDRRTPETPWRIAQPMADTLVAGQQKLNLSENTRRGRWPVWNSGWV